jgi:hypothetical protein
VGVNHWLNVLATGAQTREQLRRTFTNSGEFGSRAQRVSDLGCLQ